MTVMIWGYLFSGLLAGSVSLFAWQHRREDGMRWLAWMLIAVTEWSIGNAMELAIPNIPDKIFWAKIEFLGILSAPTFYLLFALEYNRLQHWLTRRIINLLLIIPVVSLIFVWTNDWHHLFWTSIAQNPDLPGLLIFSHGPAFWIGSAAYALSVIVFASILLFWRAAQISPVYWPNNFIVILCSFFPIAGNLLYLSNLSALAGWDPTPVAFSLGGSLIVLLVYRYRLFDMVPIARKKLFAALPDGVIILDRTLQIVDANPAAEQLLGWEPASLVGQQCASVFPDWQNREEVVVTGGTLELTPALNPEMTVEMRSLPMLAHTPGCMIILRDITATKRAEEDVQKANQVLRIQLEEIRLLQETLREQAVRDPLTGLYNRRYLAETLDREMSRARRVGEPVSVVIIDLDHFKEINDTYGHRAGDEILCMLGAILLHQTRRGDISCRYGGDEFVVILPGASLYIAMQRAEQWRTAFSATAYADGKTTLYNTFSAGLAIFPENGANAEEILAAADKALYTAKTSGRNRVVPI
jgi:diguanylate cyclase (GGDEF)-like protein